MGICSLCSGNAFFIGCIQATISNIIHNRSSEQVDILQNHSHRTPQICLTDFINVDVVVPHLSVCNIIEPINQVGNRGFSGTRCPNKGNLLPRLCIQADIMQNNLFRHIAKVHMFHLHIALQLRISHSSILMRMLPCPKMRTMVGFAKVTVCIPFRIDQMHIAFILLWLFI